MKTRHFGADGVRGRAFSPPLALSDLHRWGAAWARAAHSKGVQTLVLGWDPRLSATSMAAAFVRGVGSTLSVCVLGMVPTPTIAFVTRETKKAWGVALSGGHGPPSENGLRGFDQNGEKIDEIDEALIEEAFEAAYAPSADKLSGLETENELYVDARAVDSYLARVGTIALPDGFRVVADCAHGAVAPYVEHILRGGSIQWLGVPEDGSKINVNSGVSNLDALRTAVREFRADIGITFDGDGDRCLMIDPGGGLLDGDQMLWLLVQRRIEMKEPLPGVVGTQLSNEGLAQALSEAGIPFARASVGDKFLSRALREHGWDLGAEPSGHLVQRRLSPTGDGLLTAVSVLSELLRRKASERWAFRFAPWPSRSMNINAPRHLPLEICARLLQVMDAYAQTKSEELRAVVRWSGTEPKLRLMVEGKTAAIAEEALNQLRDAARADLQALSGEPVSSSAEHPSSSLGPFNS